GSRGETHRTAEFACERRAGIRQGAGRTGESARGSEPGEAGGRGRGQGSRGEARQGECRSGRGSGGPRSGRKGAGRCECPLRGRSRGEEGRRGGAAPGSAILKRAPESHRGRATAPFYISV